MRKFQLIVAATAGLLLAPALSNADVVDIESIVAKKAAIIRNMNDRATRAIVRVAQDSAFPTYFATHPHNEESKARIDRISLAVQSEFHVEEMCLIDTTGSEVSRIVNDQIAYDLSTEEADNAFFRPSFQQRPKTAYIAPVYISPDVFKWVVAFTTPVELDGETKAIIHYEHGLDVYQAALNKEPVADGGYVVAVDRYGFILSDSRREIPVAQRGEATDPALYFERFSLAGMGLDDVIGSVGDSGSGSVAVAGTSYAVAYRRVADWTIVGIQKAP